MLAFSSPIDVSTYGKVLMLLIPLPIASKIVLCGINNSLHLIIKTIGFDKVFAIGISVITPSTIFVFSKVLSWNFGSASYHKALDDALVTLTDRLEFGKCNMRLKTYIKPKEAIFQVVLDALALTPFYRAFLITIDVPAIYMQEF
ncbi:hypothetical protein Tco_0859057 [Tanacetum coccineum]|uniref:Uncharacterized protein n=1 Tax=Tanacetum coccineum TaxID=301880 RepID=A0ABQ5BAX6_9ASTR